MLQRRLRKLTQKKQKRQLRKQKRLQHRWKMVSTLQSLTLTAEDGKGVLTVENGKMTIHVSLASKKIVNLYPGLAEDAQKDGAELLEPTTDTVTYSDGESEEVYGFDIPVPALDKEFDVALIGEKGTWYDHKVSVTNPVKAE